MTEPVEKNRWIVEHVLALLTLGSFAYVYWLLTTIDLGAPIDPERLPPLIVLAGTLSVIAAVAFWLRMYRDFFRHRPARHAAAWGALLFFGAHLTALVYFWVVWRPRNRRA